MITAHFTRTEKPRGSGDNQLSPLLMQDFNTVDELEKFLARNRAYIVKLNFTGSLDYNEEGKLLLKTELCPACEMFNPFCICEIKN